MTIKSFKLAACAVMAAGIAIFSHSNSAQAGDNPYVGEIMMVGFSFCPRGWANADGQLIAVDSNTALFSLYGTTFGGNGRTTFGLPDLRGRVPVHTGTGAGLSNVAMGQKSGSQTNTLKIQNLPAHDHGVAVTTTVDATLKAVASGSTNTPGGQLIAGGGDANFGNRPPFSDMNASSIATNATSTVTQNKVGNGAPVNNMQPYLGIRFCVALQGIYPSRN